MPAQLNMLCQIPRLHLAWNTVKAKESVGGIDGMTIIVFEHDKRKEILKLSEKLIVKREDWVNIYPLCTECYARITYIPDIKKKEPVKIVVI